MRPTEALADGVNRLSLARLFFSKGPFTFDCGEHRRFFEPAIRSAAQKITKKTPQRGFSKIQRPGPSCSKNAGPDREIGYQSNALNQYTEINHPQTTNILGLSEENVGYGVMVTGQLAAPDQQGDRFRAEVQATKPNGEWLDVEVYNGLAPPDTQGSKWIPAAQTSPAYDADGNLLNDGRWIYTWDAENRLIGLEPTPQALAGGHPHTILEFTYDRQSRRVAKRVLDGANGNAVLRDRRFLYDGWNLVAEFEADAQNTLEPVAYHAWANDLSGTSQGAGGVGGLYASQVKSNDGSWKNDYPNYDGNGNIIAWVDDQTQVVQRLDYDAFGNELTKQGTLPGGAELNFGFSTKYQDEETGLLYYGYRFYDPVTGRWPSRDPIGERGGLNLYAMVANDPQTKWDYLGLDFTDDNDNNGIWDGLPGGYNEDNDPHKFSEDKCSKAGDIKYEKFCVILKTLTSDKEFCTDMLSSVLKGILKKER